MVFISIAFVHGLGQHFSELSPSDQEKALFYQIGFIELFAVTPCMFGRISFAYSCYTSWEELRSGNAQYYGQ
jgi:hypothetical protein